MNLKRIKIINFKSIKKIEFDIKKYGDSYTTMLVGINESGKSNILEAMSYLNVPEKNFEYKTMCNQKDKESQLVGLYFYLEFKNKSSYLDEIKTKIKIGKELLDFELEYVCKAVFLGKSEKKFRSIISYSFKSFPKLFINSLDDEVIKDDNGNPKIDDNGNPITETRFEIAKTNTEAQTFVELTEEKFKEIFEEDTKEIIERYGPKASFWKSSPEHLLSSLELIEFKTNLEDGLSFNKPLKNIFALADYSSDKEIIEKINDIDDDQSRSKLRSELQTNLNDYIKNIWNHKIKVVIDITESGRFSLSLRDTGEENQHDRFKIEARSDGAKHFLSLMLSLFIENKQGMMKNSLILIDEPEIHLHPSGARDIGKELLKIGKNNYVFIATHSPFLIDKKHKERNIIIKKNRQAETEKREIKDYENLLDEEVLKEAFGIEVYKDLLNPHRILVEGASDKKILTLAFKMLNIDCGIANGHGSNIDTIAAKLNHDDISIMVLVDDDTEGRRYKKKILKIGGVYSRKNVFTIRDLVGGIINGGTIEDTLELEFVQKKFKEFYKAKYKKEIANFTLTKNEPFIIQMKKILSKDKVKNEKEILNDFKNELSENFKPTNDSFAEKSPLLYKLVKEINGKQ